MALVYPTLLGCSPKNATPVGSAIDLALISMADTDVGLQDLRNRDYDSLRGRCSFYNSGSFGKTVKR